MRGNKKLDGSSGVKLDSWVMSAAGRDVDLLFVSFDHTCWWCLCPWVKTSFTRSIGNKKTSKPYYDRGAVGFRKFQGYGRDTVRSPCLVECMYPFLIALDADGWALAYPSPEFGLEAAHNLDCSVSCRAHVDIHTVQQQWTERSTPMACIRKSELPENPDSSNRDSNPYLLTARKKC